MSIDESAPARGDHRWRHRVIGAIAISAAAALAVPASAQAVNLYWNNYTGGSGATPYTIGRANVDGTGANINFISGLANARGIAVTRTHVYWANSAAGTIGRANRDGSGANASFITGASSPQGVAINDNYVFWANQSNDTIGRANLDGSGVNQALVTGADSPYGIAAEGSTIVWANIGSGKIGRAGVDGSAVNESLIDTNGGSGTANRVAVHRGILYWDHGDTGGLGIARVDGSGQNHYFMTGVCDYYGIAVGDEGIFMGCGDSITHADLDGGNVNLTYMHSQMSSSSWLAISPVALAQTPMRGCVTAPRRLPARGAAQLMKPGCVTDAGERVAVKLAGAKGRVGLFCKITKRKRANVKQNAQGAFCSRGALMAQTTGRRGNVAVIWDAAGNGEYKPYWSKKGYRV